MNSAIRFKRGHWSYVPAFLIWAAAAASAQAPLRTNIQRVILFDSTFTYFWMKGNFRAAMTSLQAKYGFQLQITSDSSDIDSANLSTAQLLIFAYGDAAVLQPGPRRRMVEDFEQRDGKGVLFIHAACKNVGSQWPWFHAACLEEHYAETGLGVSGTLYVDSVLAGQIPPRSTGPANADHGIKNAETRNVFSGLPRSVVLEQEWWSTLYSPRLADTAGLNVLLSADETTFTPNWAIGDHPMAWTHKMGNGLVGVNSMGYGLVNPYVQQDSFLVRFNWNLMRYLARDFVGCMDSGYAEYNPEATVTALTPLDPPNPCRTPLSILTRSGRGLGGISSDHRVITVTLAKAGSHRIEVVDVKGIRAFDVSITGPGSLEIPGLGRGVYFIRVASPVGIFVKRVNLLY